MTMNTYFERLPLGGTLKRTAHVYGQGLFVFTQLGALVVGVSAVIWALMLLLLVPFFDVDGTQFDDPMYLAEHMGVFWIFYGLYMLKAVLIGAVGNGAMIRAVADIYLQREPSFRDCVRVGLKHACSILSASFLGFLGVVLGYLMLFFPGVYISVRWFVVCPAIIIGKSCSSRGLLLLRRSFLSFFFL